MTELENKTTTQYELDKEYKILMGDRSTTKAYWNLVVSIRDVKMYIAGMKPNRHWKITPLKKYFGIKGNAKAMLEQLIKMRDEIKAK